MSQRVQQQSESNGWSHDYSRVWKQKQCLKQVMFARGLGCWGGSILDFCMVISTSDEGRSKLLSRVDRQDQQVSHATVENENVHAQR